MLDGYSAASSPPPPHITVYFIFFNIFIQFLCLLNLLTMTQNSNNSASLENCGSFCTECKLHLNSIYSIGTASSLNDSSFFVTISSPASYIEDKDDVKSQTEIVTLLDKESEIEKIGEELKETSIPYNDIKYQTHIKPTIVEDKILESSEQLKINNWKRQKSQISNYKCNNPKDFIEQNAKKYVMTSRKRYYQNVRNDYLDLKNVYKHRESKKLILTNSTDIPTHSKSQNTESFTHTIMETDYLSQYNALKNTISNRRKKITKVAQNLLSLSTYLDGICKNILETEESNPNLTCPNISSNSSKKEDKSTSPILLSNICSTVKNLPYQENVHDMYSYNPYRSKNILQKK